MVHKILTFLTLGFIALVFSGCQTGDTGPAGIPLPKYAEQKADPVAAPQTSTVPAAEYAN